MLNSSGMYKSLPWLLTQAGHQRSHWDVAPKNPFPATDETEEKLPHLRLGVWVSSCSLPMRRADVSVVPSKSDGHTVVRPFWPRRPDSDVGTKPAVQQLLATHEKV